MQLHGVKNAHLSFKEGWMVPIIRSRTSGSWEVIRRIVTLTLNKVLFQVRDIVQLSRPRMLCSRPGRIEVILMIFSTPERNIWEQVNISPLSLNMLNHYSIGQEVTH